MKNKSSLGLHECTLKATIRGEFHGIIINSEDTMKKVAFAASEYSENYIDALRENNIATQFHPERMSYKLKREDTVNGEDIFKYFKELL